MKQTSSSKPFVLSNSLIASHSQSWTNILDSFRSSGSFAKWGKCYQERNFCDKLHLPDNYDHIVLHIGVKMQNWCSCFLDKCVSKDPTQTNILFYWQQHWEDQFIWLQNMLLATLLQLWKHKNVLIRGFRNHLNSSCDTLWLDLHSSANPRKQFDNFSTKQTKKDLLSCLEPWLWNVGKVQVDVHSQDRHHGWTISDMNSVLNLWSQLMIKNVSHSAAKFSKGNIFSIWQREASILFHYITILSSFSTLLRHRYVRSLIMSTAWLCYVYKFKQRWI